MTPHQPLKRERLATCDLPPVSMLVRKPLQRLAETPRKWAGYASGAGGRLASELCGRLWFYWFLQRSISTWASGSV